MNTDPFVDIVSFVTDHEIVAGSTIATWSWSWGSQHHHGLVRLPEADPMDELVRAVIYLCGTVVSLESKLRDSA